MTTFQRQLPTTLRAALLGLLLAAAGPAMAASYNILLKSGTPAEIQTCATGGFTFDKAGVGSFGTTSPSVILNGSPLLCFGTNQSNKALATGTLSVNVADVTLNNQNQGPNVVSIVGNLSSGQNGNNDFTIRFLADKSFTVTRNTGQAPVLGSGVYHIVNTANTVPEPQTLALVLGSLAALVLSMRLRRRRRAR